MVLKKSPIAESHEKLGAKMLPFAGWEMPIHYGSVLSEHKSVRNAAGVFDVSHMCLFEFCSLDLASRVFAIDIANLESSQARYGLILNTTGGVLEDCIAYNVEGKIFVCTNAGNYETVLRWFQEHADTPDDFKDHSGKIGIIALQGPKTQHVLQKAFGPDFSQEAVNMKFMDVSPNLKDLASYEGSAPYFMARSGYTGEQGFEFFVPRAHAAGTFDRILKAGAAPIGLGARDTLRLEAGFHLHGNDMTAEQNPYEVGLGWSIPKSGNEVFTARDLLLTLDKNKKQKKLYPFLLEQKGIPRAEMLAYKLDDPSESIGRVTSGGFLPTLEKGGGMLFLNSKEASDYLETTNGFFNLDIRGKFVRAQRQKKALYKSRANQSFED